MDQEAQILLSLTRFLVSEGDKNLKNMRWVKRVEKLRDSVHELTESRMGLHIGQKSWFRAKLVQNWYVFVFP